MPPEALPSLEQVAAQFAGKPILNAQLSKESAPPPAADPAPAVQTPPPGQEIPSENAEPTGEAAEQEKAKLQEQPAEGEQKKDDPVSARFAALSRREKALRDREQKTQADLKAAEDRVKQAEERLQARIKEIEDRETAIKGAKRPLDALKAHGFKYEDATADVLGGYKPAEPDPVDEKLEPVRQKLSKLDELEERLSRWEQDLTNKEQQNNLTAVNTAIKQTISTSQERYQYLSQFGEQAIDLVRDTMVEYYTTHGQMLSYDDACDRVEEYYEEEVVSKLLNTKKIQERFKPSSASSTASTTSSNVSTQQATKKPESSSAPKTLTADMAAAGEATIDVDKMSKKDAISYLSKQLKFI